jgi:hypothetical protein
MSDRLSPSHTKQGPGREHAYGKGGRAKLRKRVTRGTASLANPFCPTDHSLDAVWKLSPTQRHERERANAR